MRLTPFGLFAIAAVTVGTADTEMGRLCVFLIGYAAMSLLLGALDPARARGVRDSHSGAPDSPTTRREAKVVFSSNYIDDDESAGRALSRLLRTEGDPGET